MTAQTQPAGTLLPLNIQFFAESGEGDSGNGGTSNDNSTDTQNTDTTTQDANTQQTEKDRIDRLIQSGIDRAMADERKKNAELQKKLDRLTKEKLSDEEIKQLEIADREKAIADREKQLQEKENRLYAIKAIKEAGLDDGSDKVLELVDLVITGTNDTEETIQNKVKSFGELVKKMVAAEVEKTFKQNGRTPNGANVANNTKETGNLAARLGKERAEQNKKASDVLSYYTGGKK